MEADIVKAMLVLIGIFAIFTVILVRGEIQTRKALARLVPLSDAEKIVIIENRRAHQSFMQELRIQFRQTQIFKQFREERKKGKIHPFTRAGYNQALKNYGLIAG